LVNLNVVMLSVLAPFIVSRLCTLKASLNDAPTISMTTFKHNDTQHYQTHHVDCGHNNTQHN
jgi:hypothetical protein